MANVTVLGAGGATVTITLSSDQNAAAAQSAINFVNKLTANGIVDQRTWAGSGTLPAPANLLSGVIVSTAGDVGGTAVQDISIAVNAPGNSTVIGSQNANVTVVSGDGSNFTYGNQSQGGKVFFGDSNSTLVNFAGNTDLTVGKGNYVLITDQGAITRVQPVADALILTSDFGGKSGKNIIDVSGKATVFASGNSLSAATINASAGELFLVNQALGSAFVQVGNANVTVVGNATNLGGRSTVLGGAGKLTVASGQGEFTGGKAGGNLMFTSTVAGSATLIGGGSGDQLFAMGSGNLLIAGAGNETLSARNPGAGDNRFVVGNGFTTVFGAGQGGNTYFFSGLGSGLIEGRDEAAAGPATQNTYQDLNSPGGIHLVGDFLTGVDQLLIPTGTTAVVSFFTAGQSGSPFGSAAGTEVKVSTGTTYQFFDTSADGKQDIFSSDIKVV